MFVGYSENSINVIIVLMCNMLELSRLASACGRLVKFFSAVKTGEVAGFWLSMEISTQTDTMPNATI